MQCSKVSFQELMDFCHSDPENNLQKHAWNLEHNTEKLYEILSRIIQA